MRRRSVGLFFICSAVVPLAIVSTAWACGVLATLKADPSSAQRNQVVNVTGVNYSTAVGASPVEIRWNERKGPLLATVVPDPTGKITTPITIPAGAKAGDNLLLALQYNANGTPKSGTPGRTVVNVVVPASRNEVGPGAAWGSSKPAGPGGAGATVSLDGTGSAGPALLPTMLGGLLSVALLGTGLTILRRSRTAKPAFGA